MAQFHVRMVLNLTKLSMPGLILMSVQNSKTYAENKSVRTLVEAMNVSVTVALKLVLPSMRDQAKIQ